MSTDTLEPAIRRGGVVGGASDGWVMAKRNLIKIKRVPDILVFVLISPIMFVLLFAYVFGGAIDVPGDVDYKEFLVPGIFAQTVVFGATFTGYGLADDMQKGIIDRFRSLPMSQSAVLVGRTTSDVAYNIISLAIMGADRPARRVADPGGPRRRPFWRSCCCSCSPTRSAGSWPTSGCWCRAWRSSTTRPSS